MNDSNEPRTPGRRHVRTFLFGFSILLVGALLLASRPTVAWWARQQTAQHIEAGRLHEANQWLARADNLASQHLQNHLLRARRYRHLDEQSRWRDSLDRARTIDPDAAGVAAEERMGELRWNTPSTIPANEAEQLIAAGVSPDEANLAVAYALLATRDTSRFESLVSKWQNSTPHPQQPLFLQGLQAQLREDWEQAIEDYTAALGQEADHALAHAALAQLLANQGRYKEAVPHFSYWARHAPRNQRAIVGWSSTLRQLNRAPEARQVLKHFSDTTTSEPPLAIEWAHVEFELGNYAESIKWFEKADMMAPHEAETRLTAATAKGLSGDATGSRALFDFVAAISDWQDRTDILKKRLANDPNDREAVAELQQLARKEIALRGTPDNPIAHPISPLFSQHCASCHGAAGDGNGLGGRHLTPAPRNLKHDPYRLVTSINRMPLQADIEAVIRKGIPGTSMPAFDDLSDEQVATLAKEVHQLYFAGQREARIERRRRLGLAEDDDAIAAWEASQRAALQPLDVPPAPAAAIGSQILNGRRLYLAAGCAQCHGPQGRGNADIPLYNDDRSHAFPRDLVAEPMKGGSDAASLFARLRLGMPGTPHPAAPALGADEMHHLIAYLQSIHAPTANASTNLERRLQANRRAIDARVQNLSPPPQESP